MHQEAPSLHLPSTQACEQHWSSPVHSLPAVLHESLSGSHVSVTPQLALQHSAPPVQPSPSDTQPPVAHWPPSQRRSQQSVGALQPAPGSPHATMDDSQLFVSELQVPEQHSPPTRHMSPNALQVGPEPPAPAPPVSAPAEPPASVPAEPLLPPVLGAPASPLVPEPLVPP
jgi:hypothetical protein